VVLDSFDFHRPKNMARGRKFYFDWKQLILFGRQFLGFDQASSNVQWMVIRNNSSFLQKRKLGTLTSVCS
jgi:hypothetical protein